MLPVVARQWSLFLTCSAHVTTQRVLSTLKLRPRKAAATVTRSCGLSICSCAISICSLASAIAWLTCCDVAASAKAADRILHRLDTQVLQGTAVQQCCHSSSAPPGCCLLQDKSHGWGYTVVHTKEELHSLVAPQSLSNPLMLLPSELKFSTNLPASAAAFVSVSQSVLSLRSAVFVR